MTIRNQTIDVHRGDTQVEFVEVTNADGTAFDPNLPGINFEWRMTTSPNPLADVLARKELGEGIEAVEGGVEIELDESDTNQVPGIYYHELKVFDGVAPGDAATIMTGTVKIRPSLRMGPIVRASAAQAAISTSAPTVA